MEYLIKNNIFYRNVKYGQEEIDALPCNDVPNGLYDTITIGVNVIEDNDSILDIYKEVLRIVNHKSVIVIPKNRD